MSKRIVADASLHAMQGAGERIPPSPTDAGLIVPVRRISAIDRLLDNSLKDAVCRFVNTPALTHATGFP